MSGRPLAWQWLGRVEYADALARQRARREAVLAGDADEAIWLLEHPPVVTVGRRAAPGTPPPALLAEQGVAFFAVERGGLATWHGPGQLVAYAVVDAGRRGLGPRGLVCALESGVIGYLASLGVSAGRRAGFPGVWAGGDKICAIGLHLSRGVSIHGIALNLCPDLRAFSLITPCGITDGGVTSVAALRGASPSPEEASAALGARLVEAIARGRVDASRGGELDQRC